MEDTLKFLQVYANASDNLWLLKKLQMLENEIQQTLENQRNQIEV
tara:strand:+ start:5045 stop:5179 length:135 start_codon:yes stop_codon:yes gene_type:complete